MSFSHLVRAYADLKQFDDAWRRIGEATTTVETTKERWFEAELHCITGEIALKSPQQDAEKAETYFEHSLAIARQQQAKNPGNSAPQSASPVSGATRARVQQARELLAPLLEELAC